MGDASSVGLVCTANLNSNTNQNYLLTVRIQSIIVFYQMHTKDAAVVIRYNRQRLAEDMALKGWTMAELASHAGVSPMTVSNVLSGQPVRPPTVKKMAKALGYSVARYLISLDVEARP
jgi:lambda repressor-like predicted transcriptional regulator